MKNGFFYIFNEITQHNLDAHADDDYGLKQIFGNKK